MMGINLVGYATDETHAPFPQQILAAIGSEMTYPAAVVYFAECGQDLAALVAIHFENTGEVLRDDNSIGSDFSEQAASRILASVFLRCAAQQPGFGERRREMDSGNF